MPNPLDYLIKDPDAMRYQLMRAAEGMKAGGKAVGGVATNPPPTEVRTPPGGHMKGVSWEAYRHAIGMRAGSEVKGYAGGGKVYGSAVPDATPPVEQMREALAERSWLDTLAGAGETGLSFLTGAVATPAAGIAGAVGETLGLGKGEDIAGRVGSALTYEPTTAAGQQMQQDLMDLMVKSGVASLPPVVSGINPAALRVNPGVGRYVGQQAVEAARPLHEAYMAGEVPGAVNPAASVVKNKGGNWLPGSVEKNLESLKLNTDIHDEARAMGMPINEQVLAEQKSVNNWVDSKLGKYIKNEMGTPEDSIRKLADEGRLHVNPEELAYPVADEHTDVRSS